MRPFAAQTEAQDIVLFLNACLSGTGQGEFYSSAAAQQSSLDFLHAYMCTNYRALYAGVLALSPNHHNVARIVFQLLASGRDLPPSEARLEGALLRRALQILPPQRVYRLFSRLVAARVNNRRTRTLMRQWLQARPQLAFDAIKYRVHLTRMVRHAHLALPAEVAQFLLRFDQHKHFNEPLFESYRQAAYNRRAIYDLPYTIAEGLAARHGIPRAEFLEKIAPRLTVQERLRLQQSAQTQQLDLDLDLRRIPLTQLALYTLALSPDETQRRSEALTTALQQAARRAAGGLQLGKVAAVLDNSWSSSGSEEKRRRPLGVALACRYLLAAVSREFQDFWIHPDYTTASGPTALADPLLAALEWGAETVVIVSDGYENDPPGGVDAVVRLYRQILGGSAEIIHLNPVLDGSDFEVRALSPCVPVLGIRAAEDLPGLWPFARYCQGRLDLPGLRQHIAAAVKVYVQEQRDEHPDL